LAKIEVLKNNSKTAKIKVEASNDIMKLKKVQKLKLQKKYKNDKN
jgi:hypothetical protein